MPYSFCVFSFSLRRNFKYSSVFHFITYETKVTFLASSRTAQMKYNHFFYKFLMWMHFMKDWRCNGKGYTSYRNYIRRPRNWDGLPSHQSTPGNRLLILYLSAASCVYWLTSCTNWIILTHLCTRVSEIFATIWHLTSLTSRNISIYLTELMLFSFTLYWESTWTCIKMHFVSCDFYFKSISLYNSDIRMIYWLMHQWAMASIYDSTFPFVRGGQLDFQQGMLQFLVDFFLIIKKFYLYLWLHLVLLP